MNKSNQRNQFWPICKNEQTLCKFQTCKNDIGWFIRICTRPTQKNSWKDWKSCDVKHHIGSNESVRNEDISKIEHLEIERIEETRVVRVCIDTHHREFQGSIANETLLIRPIWAWSARDLLRAKSGNGISSNTRNASLEKKFQQIWNMYYEISTRMYSSFQQLFVGTNPFRSLALGEVPPSALTQTSYLSIDEGKVDIVVPDQGSQPPPYIRHLIENGLNHMIAGNGRFPSGAVYDIRSPSQWQPILRHRMFLIHKFENFLFRFHHETWEYFFIRQHRPRAISNADRSSTCPKQESHGTNFPWHQNGKTTFVCQQSRCNH